jgi:hypothetical protein
MDKKELIKLIDHEIQWLYYYAHRNSRAKLTEESIIYEMDPMEYSKKRMPLYLRCSPCLIESYEEIKPGMNLESLVKCNMDSRHKRLTPLEVGMIVFPEKRIEFIQRLKFNI